MLSCDVTYNESHEIPRLHEELNKRKNGLGNDKGKAKDINIDKVHLSNAGTKPNEHDWLLFTGDSLPHSISGVL